MKLPCTFVDYLKVCSGIDTNYTKTLNITWAKNYKCSNSINNRKYV